MTQTIEQNRAAERANAIRLASQREPFRVGYIQDWGIGVAAVDDMIEAAKMAFDDAHRDGILDRPVDVVVREVDGMPLRQFNVMRDVYRELVHEQGCIGIIGPHFTDQVTSLVST